MYAFVTAGSGWPVVLAAGVSTLAGLFVLYLLNDFRRCRRRRRQILRWRQEVQEDWLRRVTSGEWPRWLPLVSRGRTVNEPRRGPPEWLD